MFFLKCMFLYLFLSFFNALKWFFVVIIGFYLFLVVYIKSPIKKQQKPIKPTKKQHKPKKQSRHYPKILLEPCRSTFCRCPNLLGTLLGQPGQSPKKVKKWPESDPLPSSMLPFSTNPMAPPFVWAPCLFCWAMTMSWHA